MRQRFSVLPPIVEAEQFTKENIPLGVVPYNDAIGGALFAADGKTQIGRLVYGDWVIYWPDERRTVCADGVFSKRYAPLGNYGPPDGIVG